MNRRSALRRRVFMAVALRYRSRGQARARNAPTVDHALSRAGFLAKSARYCVVVTTAPDGPTARVVQPLIRGDDLTVHLGTDRSTRKTGDLERTGSAPLVFTDVRRGAGLVLHCDCELVDDEPSRRRWCHPFWHAFWPDGPTTPGYVVVRCRPRRIEIWDGGDGLAPEPFGLRSVHLDRGGGTDWKLVP